MKRKESPHSENSIYRGSSSSTSAHEGDYVGGTKRPKGYDYEVFLSFRGKDTRKGFTDYLYTSLVDAGIHVFRDDNELRVGEEIGLELLCSIRESKISIPIISENYASSKWCLRELTEMLKCKRSKRQIVLPIFYKVEPSQVRHPTGKLRDAIDAHRKNMDKMVVEEWEEALKEVSSLKGWESEKIDNGHEGALVKIVVRKVMSELKRLFQLNVPDQLVGINDHVEHIMREMDAKFNGTRIIGIYGMGGIGKTTLAKVLYNTLSHHFENRSFVANIRETSQREGIKCLQKQLIFDIIGSSCEVSNVDEGVSVIKSRFTKKKVLILLDDMDDSIHLNALVGDGSWFEMGSIVIITTRNKSILNEARAGYMYPLNKLSLDQSLILFSRHAFREDSPPSDYEVISRDVVSTTGGLPLALEIIGSFLCGKREEVWNNTLKKLKKVPDKKVQEKLKISYEALDEEEQQIFLDIACFFIGSSKQNPTYMWDACDFFPGKGIEVLSLMSLIKVDEGGNLMMHDQLRDLGREIIRLENPKEPQERSRLWIYIEALDVLDNNNGTKKIEALSLGKCGIGRRCTAEQFKEMTNVRFLQVDGANFTGDFQNLLPKLRWLQWEGCPSDFAAANFHPKKLVVLNLSYSAISENWGGWVPLKMATELKVLNLTACRSLRRTPDLSAYESLEILNLRYCENLEEIHPSVGDIKTLISLDVFGCSSLKELPAGIGRMVELRELLIRKTGIREISISRDCLMKLETLSVSVSQLPEFIGSLVSLTLLEIVDSKIEELPGSIGFLEKLKTLRLSWNEKLAQLPKSMGYLVSLTLLEVMGMKIEELPESIGLIKNLKTLNAAYCESLAHIPSSIGDLASLQYLSLTSCKSLREIPNSIGKLVSLDRLELEGTSIAELPESIGNLQNLRSLEISGTNVRELPGAIGMLAKLQKLKAERCENLERLPSNIGDLVSLEELLLGESGILALPESISKLSSLQKLRLDCCKKLRELPELPSSLTTLTLTCQSPLLPHLSQLTLLKELVLSDCPRLECLPELPLGLSKLFIECCGKLKAWTNLSNLKHLSYLSLHECFHLTKVTCQEELHPQPSDNFECISAGRSLDFSSLKYVRDLVISKCNSIIEIRGPNESEFLRSLYIEECWALRSLDISNSKSLKILDIKHCWGLVKIQGLDGTKSLESLSIDKCASLTSLDLSNSESLGYVNISNCMSLGQLSDLSNLKNLKMFKVTNCEDLIEIRGLDGREFLKRMNHPRWMSVIEFRDQSFDRSEFLGGS